MPEMDGPGRISRAGFLKLGLAGLSTVAMAFVAGCGEEDDDEEDDNDD